MFKKTLILGLISIISTPVLAQTPYFQAPAKTTASGLPAVSKTIMSPSDFSSKVSKKSAENQAAFKQKLNQKIAQVPPPKIQTPFSGAFGKSNLPKAAEPTGPKKTQTELFPAESEPTIETKTTTKTPPAPASAPPAETTPEPQSTATESTAPASAPYTGFGTQQPANQTGNQNQNSGGWNVKY